MTIDELEIGDEVLCINLREESGFSPVLSANRAVGHIGIVDSVFPIRDIVYVGHLEYDIDGTYTQHLTAFYADELEIYSSTKRILQNAIKNVKKNLID